MKVMNFERLNGPVSARGFRAVGRFRVETYDGLIINDWQLVETPDGKHLAYPPAGAKQTAVVSLKHEIRAGIIADALRALEFVNVRSAA